jgi:three-Cys-motif partner protein
VTKEWGGWWTQVKLDILSKYLEAFNRASKTAGGTVYLDLFAGKLVNTRPDTGEAYAGSSARAIEALPPFSRLVFWELEPGASKLRRDVEAAYLSDSRYIVVPGDCNATLDRGLHSVDQYRWAPTFAFIDPKGLDFSWHTLERLSKWRRGKTKVEMWILLPEPALERVLGLKGVLGRRTAQILTRLYGCDDWVAIHQLRQAGELSAEETRAEYVNLLRWRLQQALGYAKTHPLALGNVNAAPMYTMIFATDHPVGSKIMHDVYDHAYIYDIPALRSRALAHRQQGRDHESGRLRLFDIPPTVISAQHEDLEPWDPPQLASERATFDDEEDASGDP